MTAASTDKYLFIFILLFPLSVLYDLSRGVMSLNAKSAKITLFVFKIFAASQFFRHQIAFGIVALIFAVAEVFH